ncbi:radical SAM protein [Paenibacillus sp. BIHB 4019]|uniref:Radical SAM protein n=1 Tax=Paenibacillus sp. BIHB 4019 TaxID=1870819 RepID=A0A1B2DMN5_9BACL|nr:4Fe-4S cluster-binding domain-containing protein [Paenibacillus sp. BIHB 4019]ANY68968.1 radical SAM protein [Paenibacillus sp. BIHB 4019]
MLTFYPQFIRTFTDLPGHLSLLIHSWNGCNMRCYGCHNDAELIAQQPIPHRLLTAEQTLERLSGSDGLFDAVLFSGGEFLLSSTAELESFLRRVRAIFNGKMIVMTNGTFPGKLQRLLDLALIDGIHIDMKLPFHLMDPKEDAEVFKAIIGVVPTERFCQDILASVEMVIRHNSRLSQVRTVRYPLLSEEFFVQIAAYVQQLKDKHNSLVPYCLNPYFPPQK